MKLQKLETGKPFPGPVPASEGVHMELWGDTLNVLIQMPGLRRDELRAFKKGFKRYSYLESDTAAPIAFWVFAFEKPHWPVEFNFNAHIVRSEFLDSYLDASEGIKNAVQFYLLNGNILSGEKLVYLDPEAVTLFHRTIRKQLETDYSQLEFDLYLIGLHQLRTDMLFQLGRVFNL